MTAGRNIEAIAAYRKSLALDPKNENAVTMLQKLVVVRPGGREAAGSARAQAPAQAPAPRLVLARQHPTPVITTRSPGAEGNRYGFEGGRVVKVDGTYHLFTTEMVADPMWVKTRFGHWTSRDRLAWTRVATVRESSGEFEGKDPRAALWSPLPVWDPGEGRWNLFYVAYRAMPTDGTRFLLNHAGEIWRAVSRTAGPQGIRGPFEDIGVIMRPGPDSLSWEGLQGTDSFFPWSVDGRWRAFYGSARTETRPIGHWLVGPAEAPSLAGPWRRLREDNPAPLATRFIENPIVTEVPGGGWLAVYDSDAVDGIGGRLGGRPALEPGPGPRAAAEGRCVGQGAENSARPRARGRQPLHAFLHGLRADAGLDTHPRHGDQRGDLRDRLRGAGSRAVTNVGRHSRSQTEW